MGGASKDTLQVSFSLRLMWCSQPSRTARHPSKGARRHLLEKERRIAAPQSKGGRDKPPHSPDETWVEELYLTTWCS